MDIRDMAFVLVHIVCSQVVFHRTTITGKRVFMNHSDRAYRTFTLRFRQVAQPVLLRPTLGIQDLGLRLLNGFAIPFRRVVHAFVDEADSIRTWSSISTPLLLQEADWMTTDGNYQPLLVV